MYMSGSIHVSCRLGHHCMHAHSALACPPLYQLCANCTGGECWQPSQEASQHAMKVPARHMFKWCRGYLAAQRLNNVCTCMQVRLYGISSRATASCNTAAWKEKNKIGQTM